MPGQKQGNTVVLKHRLAGAAVLIGFAVIVLPLLLGGPKEEPGPSDDAAASSESDTKVFHSNITPIGGATPGAESDDERSAKETVSELLGRDEASSPGAEEEDAPADQPAATGEPETADDEQPEVAARSDDTAAPEQTAPKEPTSEEPASEEPAPAPAEPEQVERGWIVQVGTFRKSDNVDRLVADLEERGFGPSTTDVDTSGGSATRVWVGPYETRVEAARVKNRVTQHTGSEALIVAYP